MNEAVYQLPWPPSVNGYWRSIVRGKHATQILSAKGRDFRKAACEMIRFQGVRAIAGPVRVVIHLHPPTMRSFDVDNYGKAILDAVQHAGVLADDSQVVDLRLVKCDKVAAGRADVLIASEATA